MIKATAEINGSVSHIPVIQLHYFDFIDGNADIWSIWSVLPIHRDVV